MIPEHRSDETLRFLHAALSIISAAVTVDFQKPAIITYVGENPDSVLNPTIRLGSLYSARFLERYHREIVFLASKAHTDIGTKMTTRKYLVSDPLPASGHAPN